MKSWMILFCGWLTASTAWAQGTVFFYNHILQTNGTVLIDAPVTDGVGGPNIDGTNLPSARVQLFAGPVGTSENNLLAVGAAVGFRTGAAAGYFDVGADGSRTIPSVPAGSNAVVQVRAWSGATNYQAALTTPGAKAGKSQVLTIPTGGTGTNGFPTLPADLVGLQKFAIVPVGGTPSITLSIALHTNVVLTLSAIAGHTYAIQYSSNAVSTNWSVLATVPLAGPSTNVPDLQSTNTTHRFYRAQQTQ